MRNGHRVGTEVECLLNRTAFGAKHFGDDTHPRRADERDDRVEFTQVEVAVFDVQHHGVVAGQMPHLDRRRRGLGEPYRGVRTRAGRSVFEW